MKRLAVLSMLTVSLCCCAAPGPKTSPEAQQAAALAAAPAVADTQGLRALLEALPGAQLTEGEALGIRYPGQVLFHSQAALPLPGGEEILEPLAELLSSQGGLRWQGRVRADTGLGSDHDLQLARHRAQLLQNYFAARGVPPARLQLEAEAAPGPPLELILLR